MRARGPLGERAAASEYRLSAELANQRPDWVDLENPRTGARYQVKAATDRSRGPPRIRLWRDQHRALLGYRAHGTPWYAFVHVSRRGVVRKIQRRKPETVTRVVDMLGGWTKGGHQGSQRRGVDQKKVPITVLLANDPVKAAKTQRSRSP